jgi:hypothetical protein
VADERLRRGLDALREERARHPHEDDERHQGHEDGRLARAEVPQPLVLRVGDLTVEDALHHPEDVAGGEDHPDGGEDDHRGTETPGADQDQELAHEAVEAGHRDRGEADQQEDGGVPGHRRLEPPELGDEPRVPTVVQHAHQEEEGPRRDPVVQHLVDRSHEAGRGKGGDPEHHEPEVGDRGVGDELLEVGLDEGDEGPVEDPDDGEDPHEGGEAHGGVGEERDRHAQEAVAPHLEEHSGEDDRARGGGLDVGVGKPGVEGPHRDLDREGEGAGEEEPDLELGGDGTGGEGGDAEAAHPRPLVQHEERHEHEHAARERVQEELHGGVDAPLVAPDPDEEVHRDEHGLPEDVEEEEVEGHEDPDHPRLEEEHEDDELADPLSDRAPRAEKGEGREEGGEDHEPEREAVHPHVVGDAPGRDPRPPLDELHRGDVPEAPEHEERQREHQGREAKAEDLLERLPAGEGHDHRPRHGKEDEDAQQVRRSEAAHDQSTQPRSATAPARIMSA